MSIFEDKPQVMILVLIILICLELLTVLVIKEHYSKTSKLKFYTILTVNFVLSIWFWYLLIRTALFKGPYDVPENIMDRMNLAGMIFAVLIPRFISILFHYTGKLVMIRKGGHSRGFTGTGVVISILIFTAVALGASAGRFNFKTEEVELKIEGLPAKLDGLKIVHISDLHLASFTKHYKKLEKVMKEISSHEPDLILNTGDFISYGWREFGTTDTILSKARGRFGNFAVLGNHDMGTYFPDASEADREATLMKMKELISASGYRLLDNENLIMYIRGVKVKLTGVATGGRYPVIEHTDISSLIGDNDSSGLRILLIHDPNQWMKDVCDKTDIELTLAGHTHGLQMGVMTRRIKWSPAQYIYPQWNGLYSDGDQYLYVNRGLGVLGIPCRIWMPPEITILVLSSD